MMMEGFCPCLFVCLIVPVDRVWRLIENTTRHVSSVFGLTRLFLLRDLVVVICFLRFASGYRHGMRRPKGQLAEGVLRRLVNNDNQ